MEISDFTPFGGKKEWSFFYHSKGENRQKMFFEKISELAL